MRSRNFVVLMAVPTLIVVLLALALAAAPPGAQPEILPTLAVLPSPTPSPTPSDPPPTAAPSATAIVQTVVIVVTATQPPSATPAPTSTPIPSDTDPPPTSTPAPTFTPAETEQAAAPTSTPTSSATEGVVAILAQTYYVSVGSANLRACARLDCAIVAPLMRGERVTVVGFIVGDVISGSNIWFALQFGAYAGYVHSSLLSESAPTPTLAPTSAAVQPSGAGILCADGTISYAASRDGACSYHGGIAASQSSAAPTSAPSSDSGSGGFTCADGTISHAAHRQGACSHHGGIAGG